MAGTRYSNTAGNMDLMPRPAISLVRVSCQSQADGVSLNAQRARILAWAEGAGFEVVASFEDVQSGCRADNRHGLQQAIDEACRRKAALIVYSLSRLARSVTDAIAISSRLEKAGADLVSLSESLDTTTASGRMIYRILATLAEFEADLTRERTRAALSHLRSQGRRISGHAPFGSAFDGAGNVVPIAAEQAVIGQVQAMRAAGSRWEAIARHLNSAGIPPKRGRIWRGDAIRQIVERQPARAAV
jgi:site-specific DNA recombinase